MKRSLVRLKKQTEAFCTVTRLTESLNKERRKREVLKFREKKQLIEWMKGLSPGARYFLTLTFSYDPTCEQAIKAAKIFQHNVSKAIAGKRATRHGRYKHPMVIVMERQLYDRWHLHVMMEALPVEYERITYVHDLEVKCAKIWKNLRDRRKKSKSIPSHRKRKINKISTLIAGEHSDKWFQELETDRDIENCFGYIVKTYFKQGGDLLVI